MATPRNLPAVTDDAPTPLAIKASLPAIVSAGGATLAPVTSGQAKVAARLNEIQTWLELPFVSPRAIATETERSQNVGGPVFLFTIERRGETQFERELPDAAPGEDAFVLEDALLWLCTAQDAFTYVDNAGEKRSVAAGDRFILSQRKNRVRVDIADSIQEALVEEGAVPNMTCKFAKPSRKAIANGWSRAVTFAVAMPDGATLETVRA